MSVTKAKFGKPVPLLVDAKGFKDGKAVLFKILKKTGGNEILVAEITSVVKREKAAAKWEAHEAKFATGELVFKQEEWLGLKDKLSPTPQKDQYSFIAIINKDEKDEMKTQGTQIEFTFPFELYIEDATRHPLDGVKFWVTFSDGSKKQGVFKKGYGKLDDAPAGKFTVEIEDHEFIFK